MSKTSFHWGDCLCGILGLKVIQLFWSEALRPLSIWDTLLMATVIIYLWVREQAREN